MMRLAMILRVARKEILSTVRDRRAIVSNLLIPLILLPAMMLGLPLVLGGLFARETATVTQIGVDGLDRLTPELRESLVAQNLELVATDEPETAVREDAFPVALAVPEGFESQVAGGERVQVTIYSKSGNLRSDLNAGKVRSAVQSYRQSIVSERVRDAGLDPSILEPIGVQTVDASREQEIASGQLAWLIPFFIAIWTLVGGQMTAIDATAGEKERGTLEVLLVAPIRRGEIVIGKFLATLVFGLSAALMAIVGFLVGGAVLRGLVAPRLGDEANELMQVFGGSIAVDPVTVLLLLGSSLLLAGVVAALLMAVAMFARSYKEAQSYIGPLSFLFILPAVGLQFRDLIDVGGAISWIPVLNVLVLMDDLIGGTATAQQVTITWLALALTVAVLLAFSYRTFLREDVIFRT
jgi:sodium transport system permease protein